MASAMVTAGTLPVFSALTDPVTRNVKKGITWGSIGTAKTVMEKFQAAKDAGFDGVEVISHLDRNEVLKARDLTGLSISSVCDSKHWRFLLSDPDPNIREEGVSALKVTLEDAAVYGAGTVVLVSGRVTETVTYDECWNRSVEGIKKALPLAEKLKIKITLENVWNNFLLSPLETVTYLDQFNSQYVAFNFDCGSILMYGWPEQWIKILGKRVAMVHVKEFSRKIASTQGNNAGFGAKLMEGDINWSAVMKALDETGFNDWITLEQPGGNTPEGLNDLYARFLNVLAS